MTESPACWQWKPPGDSAVERVRKTWMRDSLDLRPDEPPAEPPEETLRWLLMINWQRGRCAICGKRPLRLVTDHDHETGLIRGFLCQSCNALEGYNPNWDINIRYRERSPAIICGVVATYYDPNAPAVIIMPPSPDPPGT